MTGDQQDQYNQQNPGGMGGGFSKFIYNLILQIPLEVASVITQQGQEQEISRIFGKE